MLRLEHFPDVLHYPGENDCMLLFTFGESQERGATMFMFEAQYYEAESHI